MLEAVLESIPHRGPNSVICGAEDLHCLFTSLSLTLYLLTSTKWWAPASASKWRMRFNSAFKGLRKPQNWTASLV
jgi:hypothetical protein